MVLTGIQNVIGLLIDGSLFERVICSYEVNMDVFFLKKVDFESKQEMLFSCVESGERQNIHFVIFDNKIRKEETFKPVVKHMRCLNGKSNIKYSMFFEDKSQIEMHKVYKNCPTILRGEKINGIGRLLCLKQIKEDFFSIDENDIDQVKRAVDGNKKRRLEKGGTGDVSL